MITSLVMIHFFFSGKINWLEQIKKINAICVLDISLKNYNIHYEKKKKMMSYKNNYCYNRGDH